MDVATASPTGMTLEQLEQELLQLPHDVRSRLADVLARSVEAEIAAEWSVEARRRYDAYLRGEIEAYPADEAIDAIRKKLLG